MGIDSSLPERYREPLLRIVDDAMPKEWVTQLGTWLFHAWKHQRFVVGGDGGQTRINWEVINVDESCDLLGDLRAKLVDEIAPSCEACGIPDDWELQFMEFHATLYHHGCFFSWHDDAPGYDGELVESRRLTFIYYLHSVPRMFSGGELEFVNGTKVEPENNRLVLFHPLQQHQIRRVDCASVEPIHGRWAIMGWLHGPPPDGYTMPSLRGAPKSG